MKFLRNPFASESLDASLSQPLILRSYLYYLILMTVLIFFWWPRNPFASYLQSGEIPQTYFVAAIGFLASVVYLSMRFGAEDYADEDSTKIHDLVNLTPVSVATVVMGKLGAGILHTLFLLILGVPFLVAARLASGLSFEVIMRTLLIVGSSALAYRTFSFWLFTIVESRAVLKDVLLLAAAFVSIVGGLIIIPPASPISAIMSLDAGRQETERFAVLGTSIPMYMVSVIISLLAIPVFCAAASVSLRVVRRRHAARAKPATAGIAASGAGFQQAGGALPRLAESGEANAALDGGSPPKPATAGIAASGAGFQQAGGALPRLAESGEANAASGASNESPADNGNTGGSEGSGRA